MTGGPLRQASPLKARSAQAGSGTVRVICGVHTLEAHVAGRTVGDVRAALGQALNVSPAAVAVVDGVEVGAGHVLREGEQLEFVRLAGEKGLVSGPPFPVPGLGEFRDERDQRTLANRERGTENREQREDMERSDEAMRARFRGWDRQIAALQDRCLRAPAAEAERLRGVLAALAAARERAWSRWELARPGGMWVAPEDIRRFEDGIREAEQAFARAAGGGTGHGTARAA